MGINNFTNNGHEYDKRMKDMVERGTMRVNDLIAPDAMENGENHIKVGNRFYRTIVITGYPRTASIGWLNQLYSFGANIDISSHIEPLPTPKVIKMLNRKIGEYNSTINMNDEKGKQTDISINTALGDAENLRDKLHKGQEKLFYQSIYINIAGKTLEELNFVSDEIETLCGSLNLITRHAMFEHHKGFNSVLPIGDNRLRFKRNFDSSSLATCFPIVSAELTSTSGVPILYGLNDINGSLVLFDRFSFNNYNSVVVASSGSGKSYFVKLESIRYLSMGTEVIILDPQNEYSKLAKAMGGQYIDLSSSSPDRINPLDIEYSDAEEDGRDFLTQKILDVYSIIQVMLGERKLEPKERKIVFQAIEDTYKKFGITRDKKSIVEERFDDGDTFTLKGSKKTMPTLDDLNIALRSHGDEGVSIAEELDPYISGFLNLFNGETNVNPNSNFLVFGIKDMEAELASLAMFITLEFIWNKIKSGDKKKRMIVVDEAWMLMRNKATNEYLLRLSKTCRKFRAGLTLISQQPRDFMTEEGDKIIGNTSMQVLLKQHHNDIADVSKMFGLSPNEESLLKTAQKGEALIFAGGNHTTVNVLSNEFEHLLCTTDPEEDVDVDEILALFA